MAARTRWRFWASFVIGLFTGLSLAATALLTAAALALRTGRLPPPDVFRARIEHAAAQALHMPVRIGSVAWCTDGWRPCAEARAVSVGPAPDRPELMLPRVTATLSLRSVLNARTALSLVRSWGGSTDLWSALQPRFASVRLERPQVRIHRDVQGRFAVAGMPVGGSGGPGASPDFIVSLGGADIRVAGGQVILVAAPSGASQAFSDVEAAWHGGPRRHRFELSATPSDKRGDRFSLSGWLTEPRAGAATGRWSGRLDVDLPRAHLDAWQLLADRAFWPEAGQGTVRAAWAFGAGRLHELSFDFELHDVQLRAAPDRPSLALARAGGQIEGRCSDHGCEWSAHNLGVTTARGQVWPRGDAGLSWFDAKGASPPAGMVRIERLDLATLAELARHLPIPEPWRLRIAAQAPRGVATAVQARWTGSMAEPIAYRASARVTGLSVRGAAAGAGPGWPGLTNAGLTLSATDKGGQALLHVDGGGVLLPGVWAEPRLPVRVLDARLIWKVAGSPFAMQPVSASIQAAKFDTGDVQGDFTFDWQAGACSASDSRFELRAHATGIDAQRVSRYLPSALGEHVRETVAASLRGGRFRDLGVELSGVWNPGSDLAAALRGATVHARAHADDVSGTWPALADGTGPSATPAFDHASGELMLDGATLMLREGSVSAADLEWTGLNGQVHALAGEPELELTGQAHAALADLLKAGARGAAELRFSVRGGLGRLHDAEVRGDLALAGSTLHLEGGSGACSERPSGPTPYCLKADGTVQADTLSALGSTGEAARWAAALHGATHVQMALALGEDGADFALTTSLAGMSSDLPAPLGKSAGTVLPLRLGVHLPKAKGVPERVPSGSLSLSLGDVLQARFERNAGRPPGADLRGAIGVGKSVAMPPSGIVAGVVLDRLDATAWRAWFAAMPAGGGEAWMPQRIDFAVDDLALGQARLLNAEGKAWRDDDGWRLALTVGSGSWQGLDLGRLALDARRGPAAPGWNLVRLEANASDARLAVRGASPGVPARGRDVQAPVGAVDVNLQLVDAGAFLERLGWPAAVRGGHGAIAGQLAWTGLPAASTLSGRLHLSLQSGQLLKGEPGLSRWTGLLSLQSLPRRLVLDFHDLFAEGLTFDAIEGDVDIDQGVLTTHNGRLRGPQADMLVEGQADAARRALDLRMAVVPRVDAGAVSLAYAAVNPVLGLGSFLTQALLHHPLSRAATREYRISGPWGEPKVERIETLPEQRAPTPPVHRLTAFPNFIRIDLCSLNFAASLATAPASAASYGSPIHPP